MFHIIASDYASTLHVNHFFDCVPACSGALHHSAIRSATPAIPELKLRLPLLIGARFGAPPIAGTAQNRSCATLAVPDRGAARTATRRPRAAVRSLRSHRIHESGAGTLRRLQRPPTPGRPIALVAAPKAHRLPLPRPAGTPGYCITVGVHAVNDSGITGKPTDAQIFSENVTAMSARRRPHLRAPLCLRRAPLNALRIASPSPPPHYALRSVPSRPPNCHPTLPPLSRPP